MGECATGGCGAGGIGGRFIGGRFTGGGICQSGAAGGTAGGGAGCLNSWSNDHGECHGSGRGGVLEPGDEGEDDGG